MTALNTSKTAYVSFAFQSRQCFAKYHFEPSETRGSSGQARFTCQLYNKVWLLFLSYSLEVDIHQALLSVFRGRLSDSRDKDNDTSLERCELSLQDRPDQAECRLIAKMICRNGVLKTYKLTYENIDVSAAIFDRSSAQNRWTISSRIVRDFIEYFGAKTEYLDIYSEGEKATFTSYTEKIMNGKGRLTFWWRQLC
jgi:cell cycle checkpoint control protein RAD9A